MQGKHSNPCIISLQSPHSQYDGEIFKCIKCSIFTIHHYYAEVKIQMSSFKTP